MNKEVDQGYDAYLDHLRFEDNPYPDNSKEWEDWNSGYTLAYLQYEGYIWDDE